MSAIIIERLVILAGEETNAARRESLIEAAKHIAHLQDLCDMFARAMHRMREVLHGKGQGR